MRHRLRLGLRQAREDGAVVGRAHVQASAERWLPSRSYLAGWGSGAPWSSVPAPVDDNCLHHWSQKSNGVGQLERKGFLKIERPFLRGSSLRTRRAGQAPGRLECPARSGLS